MKARRSAFGAVHNAKHFQLRERVFPMYQMPGDLLHVFCLCSRNPIRAVT